MSIAPTVIFVPTISNVDYLTTAGAQLFYQSELCLKGKAGEVVN